jgi:iron complex transport system substrate-binding protein
VPVSLENLPQIDGDWMFLGALGTGSTGGVAQSAADLTAARQAVRAARETPGFTRLRAVRRGRVVPVDGSAWTSAGGPLAENVVLDDVARTLAAGPAAAGIS